MAMAVLAIEILRHHLPPLIHRYNIPVSIWFGIFAMLPDARFIGVDWLVSIHDTVYANIFMLHQILDLFPDAYLCDALMVAFLFIVSAFCAWNE